MQNIDSDLIRGNIDTIILKTMLNEDKYGLDIIKEVSDKSSGTYELKQPTLYSCLKRLENQALISSYWVDSEIGGKRHYYKLTDKGRDFYNKKQEEWARSKFIIDNLLSNYDYEEYRLVKKDEYNDILERQSNLPLNSEIEQNNQPQEEYVASELSETFEQNEGLQIEENIESEHYQPEQNSPVEDSEHQFEDNEENIIDESLNQQTNADNDVFDLDDVEEQNSFEDDDYPVYFEAKEQNTNEKKEYVSYETSDQSSNELNILNRLRNQEDETINTYYGDQNSYVNHLRSLDESQLEQQDLLDSSLYSNPNDVNKSIDDFSDAIKKLNDFGNFSSNQPENDEDFEDEIANEESFGEYNPTSNVEEIKDFPNDETDDFDELDELESIKNISSNKFFNSFDESDYDKNSNQVIDNTNYNFSQNENLNSDYNTQEFEDNSFENENFSSDDYNIDDDFGNNFAIDTTSSEENLTEETNEIENNMSQIDSIISKNMTTVYTEPTPSFYISNTNNYREKLSNLSKYSRVSLENEKEEKDNKEALEKAKNIAEITKELEDEGIKIKEHYTQTNSKKLDRNYLLANRINLVKSLILLFGYVFILSATYIILNNTSLKSCSWFDIKPFLIGIIPFAVYTLYYLILFIVNPYKKIDAKFHFRIMLFISIIVTIQLLLITYCVNLQLGFYSFTQKEFNHLYWIIPGLISIAPIIDNLVYLALFKSRNFNV